MSDEVTICETCRKVVDPADPNIVRGVEIVITPTPEEPGGTVEGMGAFFHAAHFPASGYRRAPKTSAD